MRKNKSGSCSSEEICSRIADIRRRLHGKRGKAQFAKDLGISASTYNYYEKDRIPPAELLVRIADVGGVDLRWLLTGTPATPAVPPGHPAVRRIAALLADRPDAAAPLTAFVDLLSAAMAWPAKPARPEAAPMATVPDTPEQRQWVPILGRSAAGVPHFWADDRAAAGVTTLGELIARHAGRAPAETRRAAAADAAGRDAGAAQLITLREPEEADVAEFVVAGGLKARYGDAFAVRIDGDSMSPEIRHGDVVVCSPSHGPAEGQPAVVQLQGQIGVTCKLYRRVGDTVHLIPVNEQYAPQSFPAANVTWALRVLARVRPG